MEHWRVAYLDSKKDPILYERHRKTASKVIRRVICLDDNKIFDNCQETGRYYGVIGSQISECARGKLKSVYVGEKRLRFAYLDGNDSPVITKKHHESLDASGKYKILHLRSGKVFLSLNAFCRETGVPWKRAKNYLEGKETNLLGNEFKRLD